MNLLDQFFHFYCKKCSGDKGEPGADCDVIDKVDQINKENKILKEKVSTLERTVDGIVTKLNETR